jgi:aminotransferase
VLRIVKELSGERVVVKAPMGAFYFFLDFRSFGISSVEICERLLVEAGVGLVPGSAFGVQGEGFVRMTIAAADEVVEAGIYAILKWAEKQ